MSGLDETLSDFNLDMERAENLLALVKNFREFGASDPPIRADRDSDPWSSASELFEASKHRRTDLPVLAGSLQLYIAGRFEYCMRQVVETVADDIASLVSRYSDLPETIRTALKSRTLEVAQNPKRYGFDDSGVEALLTNLVANIASTTSTVSIVSSVLSITEGNLKDRVLADLLKRIGMTDYWKDVGKQTAMKLALDRTSDGEATVAAQTFLNAIMEERNQVAHPTASTTFPDPDKVLAAARFLRILAATTIDLAKVYLSAHKAASH
jgi:hypothetical protein